MDAKIAGGQEANASGYVIIKDSSRCRSQPESRADCIAVTSASVRLNHQPVSTIIGSVEKNGWSLIERCDDNIRKTVVVQVREGSTTVETGVSKVGPHFCRYVCKSFALRVLEKREVLCGIRHEVVDISVGAEQVFPSIVVVIDEAGAPSGKTSAQLHQFHRRGNIVEVLP